MLWKTSRLSGYAHPSPNYYHILTIDQASGLLGSRIPTALVSSGYTVTAIQRKDSQKPLHAGLQVVKTDLSDEAGLTQVFKGQDVVIR